MAELAYVESMREESCECVEFIEYLEGVEEDISKLGLTVDQMGQQGNKNESLESKSLETMMTYFMILEEELTIEKQKVLRLQKLNQEIEKDRFETEELNKELMKQKHKLETENQQLRQRLWRVRDLFTKSTDELLQLRRENRMLHEVLEMSRNSSLGDKIECNTSHTLPRSEKLEKHASQNMSQHSSNLNDKSLNTSTSEPNIQHFSSQCLPIIDEICRKNHSSILRDFIALKQSQQKNNIKDVSTAHLEEKSKQHKPKAEEPSTKEESVLTNNAKSSGCLSEGCHSENIPVMAAPLPKDLLILFDNNQPNGKSEQRDKDIKKLEECNDNLAKVLQKLEMQCCHDNLNRRLHASGQDPADQICSEISKRNILTRKLYPGCNATEEALLKAVKAGSVANVRQAISEGADVNVALLGKWTPLHIAAALGFVYICEELLDAGALKHTRDRWGDTPLHWAAVKGCQEVASLLVHHGDDVFRCGRGDKTPKEKALAAGHNDLADWFAKKEQEQRKGSTAT